jgi:transcription antitermination factor NusG
VTEEEIDNVRRYAAALTATGGTPEPYPLVEVGQRVVVTEGPFRDVEGIVVDIRGQSRILIGIAALGQGFALNVTTRQLRPI